MRKSRYSDSQILAILKQNEQGIGVSELCREHGMSSAQFYKWRSKFGGMDASMMKRLKELEEENRRLKKMYAEEKLKAEIVREAIEKKWYSHPIVRRWHSELTSSPESVSGWSVQCLVSVKAVITIRRGWPRRMRR